MNIYQKTSLIVLLLLTAGPLYAQKNENLYNQGLFEPEFYKTDLALAENPKFNSSAEELIQRENSFFENWFNSPTSALNEDGNKERMKLRDEWKDFIRIDIFYTYFKAEEIENYIKEKTSLNFLNLKGSPKFDKTSRQVRYIFKEKF